jgi:hypothetical protein
LPATSTSTATSTRSIPRAGKPRPPTSTATAPSDHLDRQILYANSGFAANQAPTTADLPLLQTHIDLGTTANLASTAHDPEGDLLFWRVLDATHGTAQLGVDGQTLIFTPATGYTGTAQITVQADDGYNAGTPIELVVNVSGARLTAIHLAPLARLQAGQTARVHATLDFEDQQGVALTDAAYLDVTVADIAGMGYVGTSPLQVDDARDQIRATGEGPALVVARRMDGDGRMLQTVAAINVQPALPTENPTVSEEEDAPEALAVKPDVYPGTLALVPGSNRQLKVHVGSQDGGELNDVHSASQIAFAGFLEQVISYTDPDSGETTQFTVPAQPALYSGTRYLVSDPSVATVSADGLITALKSGTATLSVIHLATDVDQMGNVAEQVIGQSDVLLMVAPAQSTDDNPLTDTPAAVAVNSAQGGVVQASTGEMVMVGAGALKQDTAVAIHRLNIDGIEATLGMPLPAPTVLQVLGAFKLDVGTGATTYPLQVSVPLQNTNNAQVGDEVGFFRKGKVLQADGTYKDTWWLVDNGYLGTDAAGILSPAPPAHRTRASLNRANMWSAVRSPVLPAECSSFGARLAAG